MLAVRFFASLRMTMGCKKHKGDADCHDSDIGHRFAMTPWFKICFLLKRNENLKDCHSEERSDVGISPRNDRGF